MNTVQAYEGYGDDCPFPFFDEPTQSAKGCYKIYHDGGSYVATRVWRRAVPRERKERESEPTKQIPEEKRNVMFNRILRKARKTVKGKKDKRIALGLDLGVVRRPRAAIDILFDGLYSQAMQDGLKDGKIETALTDYIRAGIVKLFPHFPDLDEYIERKIKAKRHNLAARKKRFRRKANLNRWNYYFTVTFDDKKHTPESFEKSLRKCFSNLHTRRGWRIMGKFEHAPDTGRLHFHGVAYVPEGEMVGTIAELKDYSTAQGRMQTRHENSFFQESFGRNDFTELSAMELKYGRIFEYIIKYIGKDDGRMYYSRGIPTEVYKELTADDIITGFIDYVEKFVLQDSVVDWERDIMHYNRRKQMSIIDLLCNPPRVAA